MANDKKSGGLKWLILGIVLLVAVGAGAWLFKKKGDDAPEFQTTKVTRGDITQAVTATGTLNPVLNVQVGSQISGIIQKLHADFNSRVKAGDLVAQLDPATYQMRVQQNEGD
ncbi:MAG: biotin/lipoyl-binding protein, partial [Verrucomicrobiales bacterium]